MIRHYLLKRVCEVIALVSVLTTVFLFIQTRELSHRLQEIQDPSLDLTAFVNTKIDSGKSGGVLDQQPKSYFSRELSHDEKLNVSTLVNCTVQCPKMYLFGAHLVRFCLFLV